MATEQKYSDEALNRVLISRISSALAGGLSVSDCAVLLERGTRIAAGIASEHPDLAESVDQARTALPWAEIDAAFCAGLRTAGRRAHSQVRLRMALRQLEGMEMRLNRCSAWVEFAEKGLSESDLRSASLALHFLKQDWQL